MAVAQLMAGGGSSDQHQRIGLRVEVAEERDKSPVQGAQPTALDPAFQQHQQIVDAGQRAQVGEADVVQRSGQQIVERAAHANAPGRSGVKGLP
ncbi:hypothetical protein ALO94_200367 [Pseudomonas syringae pv. spinaceae]|uniref:N-methylproline demethylase n=1 Tax=Pseudomonas syringae pv. spinaceae TaxID=264459 RepID=A0A0Q0D7M7_PSESX|nr:hypothetical protein ALO94_200367 [Pseudomonas syringae pv. spinaceae]